MAAKDNDDRKQDDSAGKEPMIDMSQTAVKKMIAEAREKGYITYDQLNHVLPPDQVSSEQIEDVMSMLSEMGINVVDNEETEDADAKKGDGEGDGEAKEETTTTSSHQLTSVCTIEHGCLI